MATDEDTDTSDGRLYHLALADEWEEARAHGGPYRRSTLGVSLEEQGFIHCSFADQVATVAATFYAGRDDVVVLVIDPERVTADIKVEPVGDDRDQEFPHLYGPLNLDAVVAVRALRARCATRPFDP